MCPITSSASEEDKGRAFTRVDAPNPKGRARNEGGREGAGKGSLRILMELEQALKRRSGRSLGNEKGRSGYTQFLDHAVGYHRADELETIKAADLEGSRPRPEARNRFLAATQQDEDD